METHLNFKIDDRVVIITAFNKKLCGKSGTVVGGQPDYVYVSLDEIMLSDPNNPFTDTRGISPEFLVLESVYTSPLWKAMNEPEL